jgi:4-hydroxybutyrate CoA-transferase
MDWKKIYKERTTSADEAVSHIKSGDRIVAGHATGSPEVLLKALTENAQGLKDVEIVHMVSMGESRYCLPEYEGIFRHRSLFAGPKTRKLLAEGKGDYTPCHFSEIPLLFRNEILPVDVALITVSPPDKSGYVSLGVSVDYTMEAALKAKKVIAEVTPEMPSTCGYSFLHVSQIDHFVESTAPIIELAPPKIGDTEKAIGENVAKLIKDGDCLQLGIGAIPDATLTFLTEKKDLGIHSEMVSDGVMHLVEKGVVNGRKKNFHPGKIVICFAMGSRKFYQWLDNNSMIEMYPVDYSNDPFLIAKNDNMVSINSAISVDLLGQVAADTLGSVQFSGVGGQVDFVRGAKLSKGGRSIIALPSTAAKGTKSRIVSALEPGQAVTTSRNDVDYIVTEFGIAHLGGHSVRERAKALISVAHPDFRQGLEEEFGKLFYRLY